MGEDQANNNNSQPAFVKTATDSYSEPLRSVGSFFREHPAIFGSLVYLQVTTVGVVYLWVLFRRFDINVFDYAEANDFLLAAFKDPVVFAMSMISIITVTVFTPAWARFLQRRTTDPVARSWLAHSWLLIIGTTLTVIVYTLVPPYLFADLAADKLQYFDDAPLINVQYRATEGSNEQTEETGLGVIGTTENFVFFYDREETKTLIIPTTQIVEMTHCLEKEQFCK